MQVSFDSKQLFIPWSYNNFRYHELVKFDNETGQCSDLILIKDSIERPENLISPATLYNRDGVFSQDGKKLYLLNSYYFINQPSRLRW